MADFQFKIEKVFRYAGALAERMSVLRPLSGKNDCIQDADVEKAAFEVLEKWRRRCSQLREAGWGPANTIKFQYMRNCPMTSVKARPQTASGTSRPCNHSVICPWCWARDVTRRTYDAVSEAMRSLRSVYSERRTGDYPYKLVLNVTHGEKIDSEDHPSMLLASVRDGLDRRRRNMAGVAIGLAQLGVVQPGKKNWLVSRRTLALVPADTPTPLFPGKGKEKVVEHPTKRHIAGVVARFARYPVGLIHNDLDKTIRLLECRSRFRLLRIAGTFYSSPNDTLVDDDDNNLDTRYLDL